MRHWRCVLLILALGLCLAPPAFATGGIGGDEPPPDPPPSGDPPPPPPPPPPNMDENWKPYGFAIPGDPTFSFGYPQAKTLLGLAAKGNIILGDYTDPDFQTYVAPKLRPGEESVTQPYVIDPTDAELGYSSYVNQGRQYFNGDYTQVDEQGNGQKLDGTPRRFYESSLPDNQFSGLVDPWMKGSWEWGYPQGWIDAILYTNHAVGGLVKALYMELDGSMVARDDALIYGKGLNITHDARIMSDSAQASLGLPVSIKRPRLVSIEDCPTTGCSP